MRLGYPPFADWTGLELHDQFQPLFRQIQNRLQEIEPESLDHADAAIEAMSQISESLRELETGLAPLLPRPERRAFGRRVSMLTGNLQVMREHLEGLLELWQDRTAKAAEETPVRDLLLARAAGVTDAGLRNSELALLWHSLRGEAENHEDASGERWDKEFELLQWAVSAESRDRNSSHGAFDPSLLYSLWRELAEAAMQDGYEARLARLQQLDQRHGIGLPADETAFLDSLRNWWLGRYRLREASRINRFFGSQERENRKNLLLGFFGQFSPIWVSLVVGAILMLDFGDPWSAMAEDGDVRGILISFFLALGGIWLYLVYDLRKKVALSPGETPSRHWRGVFLRTFAFLSVCLAYALVLTSLLWLLLSGTDEVVQGPNAVLHIVVWAAFSLFIGIFFGLIAKTG